MILDWITYTLLAAGCLFIAIGTLGILKLPDFYTRLHAAGVIDTLGAGLILTALLLQSPSAMNSIKLILIAVLMYFANPTTSHFLARAAYAGGVKPMLDDVQANEADRDD